MVVSSTSELGEAIRGARRAQGLRQTELALAAGTGRRFIVDLERGKPTAQVGGVLRVLQALGLDLDLKPHGAEAGWKQLS